MHKGKRSQLGWLFTSFKPLYVLNWFFIIKATKIYFVPFQKASFRFFLECSGAQMVRKQNETHGSQSWVSCRLSTSSRVCRQQGRPHGSKTCTHHQCLRTLQHISVWTQKQANLPVVFVKCHHLKRTTKISVILKVLAVAERFSRKNPLLERRIWRLESCLLHALGVWKWQIFEGERWRIKWYILLRCLIFQSFVTSWEW